MVGRIVSLFSCKKLKNPFYCLGSEEDFSLAKARRNRFSAIEKKIISFISIFWKSTYRLWINQRFSWVRNYGKASKYVIVDNSTKEMHIIHIAVDKSC